MAAIRKLGAEDAIRAAYAAAEGDSNDAEIEALQECRDLLALAYGIDWATR